MKVHSSLSSIVFDFKKRVDADIGILSIITVSLPTKEGRVSLSPHLGKYQFWINKMIECFLAKGFYGGEDFRKVHAVKKVKKFLIIVLPPSVKKDSG